MILYFFSTYFPLIFFFIGAPKDSKADLVNQIKQIDSMVQVYFDRREISRFIELYFTEKDLLIEDLNFKLRANVYYRNGRRFQKLRLFNEAIKNFENQIKINREYQRFNFQSFLGYGSLIDSYREIGKYNKAVELSLESMAILKKRLKYGRYYAARANDLGMIYQNHIQQLDSAQHYFQMAIDIFEERKLDEKVLFGSICDNLAQNHFMQGNYRLANNLYLDNFQKIFYKDKNEQERFFRAGIQLVETQILLRNYSSAQKVLDSIEPQLMQSHHKEKNKNRIHFYEIKSKFLRAVGDFEEALLVLEKAEFIRDSIRNEEVRIQRISSFELNNQRLEQYEDKLELETLKREKELQRKNFRFWLVIQFFSFVLAIVYLIYLRQRKNVKLMFISRNLALRKAEIQSLQNHLLEKDLENQKKDLTHIAINVKENSEWLEVLHDKIKEFVSSSEEDRNKALRKLNSFIINRKQAAALSDELVAKVERLNTRFYSKLQKKYPNLTSYEVKLCSLIRIGLSSKQIASILNINHDSVNKSRYRLRKKLALSPHQEIILFLKNV